MTERLTTGTRVVGELDEIGFWPVDMQRITKPAALAEDIEIVFND